MTRIPHVADPLQPCRCPSCREELIIACPNGCENAELGAVGWSDPVAMLPKPKGREPRQLREKASNICPRCGKPIPPQIGRAPKFHAECRTEQEKRTLAQKHEYIARQRKAAA